MEAFDELEYARQNITYAHRDFQKVIIDTIFVYIWPALFEPESREEARELLELACEHMSAYPCFDKDTYCNLCTHLFAKLAWYYAEDAKIPKDEHYERLYAMFLAKGWSPITEDVKVVNYASRKTTYLAYLYNKDPSDVLKVNMGVEGVHASIYRNDVGILHLDHATLGYVNMDVKEQRERFIVGVDISGELYIRPGDVLDGKWKITKIAEINDALFLLDLSVYP